MERVQNAISLDTYCTSPVKPSSAARRQPVRSVPTAVLAEARRDAPAPDHSMSSASGVSMVKLPMVRRAYAVRGVSTSGCACMARLA